MSLTSDMWHYTVLLYHLGEQREQVSKLKNYNSSPSIQKIVVFQHFVTRFIFTINSSVASEIHRDTMWSACDRDRFGLVQYRV